MKSLKLRILLLTILLVKVEAQEIVLDNRSPETNARTEEREGLKYIPGKKLPFTGKIFSPYNKRLRGIETNYRPFFLSIRRELLPSTGLAGFLGK